MDETTSRMASRFLNEDGQVIAWPSKRAKKLSVLAYLAEQFAFDVDYDEREVNAILDRMHVFEDCALLRRELFDHGLLDRTPDGSRYWRVRLPEESSD